MIFASVGYFGLTLGHGDSHTNGYVMVCSPGYDLTKVMPLISSSQIIFTCIFLLFYATTWAPISKFNAPTLKGNHQLTSQSLGARRRNLSIPLPCNSHGSSNSRKLVLQLLNLVSLPSSQSITILTHTQLLHSLHHRSDRLQIRVRIRIVQLSRRRHRLLLRLRVSRSQSGRD